MFAICCGYEDADDLDHLRSDPAFKLACGRLPDTGRDLCSQPTLSRLENSPRLRYAGKRGKTGGVIKRGIHLSLAAKLSRNSGTTSVPGLPACRL
jgi:hypothetical protein